MIFIILNQLYVGWRQFGMVITFLQSTLKPNGISPEYITDQDCLRSDYDEDTSSLKKDKYRPFYGNAYFPFYLQNYWKAFQTLNEKKILNTYSSIQLQNDR